MSEVIVRRATSKNLDQLKIVFDEYRTFYGAQSDIALAESFLKERLDNKESVIFLAQDKDDNIAGFVQLYPLFSSTRMKRLWLLNDLYVLKIFRGLKISVQLINAAKTLGFETNAAGLLLETAKDNIIANNLYRSTGFHRCDQNFYEWRV